MSKAVSIKNLNFNYDSKQIFSNFNLDINSGEFVSLIGPNGSGKSTLIKIIVGLLEFDGEVYINDLLLNKNNIKQIRKKVGVLLNNVDSQLISNKVFDNIAFPLVNQGISRDKIITSVEDIASKLNIKDLLNKNISEVNNMEKTLINLASVLVYKPEFLIFDEAFENLDKYERDNILTILKNLNKIENITIIDVTQNMEDILFGNMILILDNGKIAQYDSNDKIFDNSKIFSKLGLDLPFMVDLSIKLKYYNLIDRIIYDMEEMVDVLWK